MIIEADRAAERLFRRIKAPLGSFNTSSFADSSGTYIRVSIDREYLGRVKDIPETFDGFRVVIERREPVIAHSSLNLV
jgi:hypothetical protein